MESTNDDAANALDSQREVIAGILADPTKLGDARALIGAEHFTDSLLMHAWVSLCELEDRDAPGDIRILVDMLKAGGHDGIVEWLRSMVVPSGAFVAHHTRVLVGALKIRRLRAVTAALAVLVQDVRPSLPGVVDRVIEDAEQALQAWYTESSPAQSVIARVASARVLAALDSPVPNGLHCGLEVLDDTCSGLRRGTLTVIAARTSHGKSTIALQIALNLVRRGLAALFATIEMSTDDVMSRALSNLSGVPHHRLLRKQAVGEERMALNEAHEQIEAIDTRLELVGGQWISPTTVRSKARQFVLRHGERACIVVDYLQILEMPEAPSREQAVAAACRSMKEIAIKLNVPVILLAQLNRAAAQEGEPQLHHLRESGAIEQDADVVLLLHVAPEDEQSSNASIPLQVSVAKNRAGPRARAALSWERPLFRIRERELDLTSAVPLSARVWGHPDPT